MAATIKCICPRLRDIYPMRIADLCCPKHGVNGTDPGDGEWDAVDFVDDGEVAASVVLAHIVQAIEKAELEGALRIKIETIRHIIDGE